MSVKGIIEGFIRERHSVTFEEFMDLSLYHPRAGYYTGKAQKIGLWGDFYTSPEVSPLFGYSLAGQINEMWQLLGSPDLWQVVEYGAGRGKMARDILSYLKYAFGEAYAGLTYYIVEISPYFKKVQQDCLVAGGTAEKVSWISEEELSSREAGITGCIVSNEFVDAMPVHRVKFGEGRLLEARVCLTDDGLRQYWSPAGNAELEKYFSWLGFTPLDNHEVEVNLRAGKWLARLSKIIKRGYVITIDYGSVTRDLFDESRPRGTLRCFKGHRLPENPLECPGEADITASVDFSALIKWGEQAGLTTAGYTSQMYFLLNMGIFDMISSAGDYKFNFNSLKETMAVKKLLLPEGMGSTFKFLCQSKGAEKAVVPRGFKKCFIRNRGGVVCD